MLQSRGSQRGRHDWVTEQQQQPPCLQPGTQHTQQCFWRICLNSPFFLTPFAFSCKGEPPSVLEVLEDRCPRGVGGWVSSVMAWHTPSSVMRDFSSPWSSLSWGGLRRTLWRPFQVSLLLCLDLLSLNLVSSEPRGCSGPNLLGPKRRYCLCWSVAPPQTQCLLGRAVRPCQPSPELIRGRVKVQKQLGFSSCTVPAPSLPAHSQHLCPHPGDWGRTGRPRPHRGCVVVGCYWCARQDKTCFSLSFFPTGQTNWVFNSSLLALQLIGVFFSLQSPRRILTEIAQVLLLCGGGCCLFTQSGPTLWPHGL